MGRNEILEATNIALRRRSIPLFRRRRAIKATAQAVAALLLSFVCAKAGHATFIQQFGTILDDTPTHFLFEVDYDLTGPNDLNPSFDFITIDTSNWSMTIQITDLDFSMCISPTTLIPTFCNDDLTVQSKHLIAPDAGEAPIGPLLTSLHYMAGSTIGAPFLQTQPNGVHLGPFGHSDTQIFTTFQLNATTGRAVVELFHPSIVPEPSTALLLGLGLIGLATRQRKSTLR